VVAFAAAGAGQVAAPGRALAVVVFGDGKGCAAAARDQKHLERGRALLSSGLDFARDFASDSAGRLGLPPRLHDSSTAARLRLRLLACRNFFRRRNDFGVTSTNSSSAM